MFSRKVVGLLVGRDVGDAVGAAVGVTVTFETGGAVVAKATSGNGKIPSI